MAEQFVELTPEEQEIIQAVMAAESFRNTAWAEYGVEWVNHIPTAINAFVFYYFGMILFPYQLAVYYCPNPEATIHGGRGSGKTEGLAIAGAAYHALHPGEDWLHVSITKDQAKKSFDAIMRRGAADGIHPRFVERFVAESVVAPFPEIRLKRWSKADPGTIIRFRGIGDDDIERLRSYEAGTVSVDEAFRKIKTADTYSQLRGCIRGANLFRLNSLTPEEREDLLIRTSNVAMIIDPFEREAKQGEIEREISARKLNKRNFMLLYGNAGPNPWEWERHDRGRTDPEHYFSYTATSYDNPFFGQAEREAVERSFGDNRELLEIEMFARRPRNLGDVFEGRILDQCLDPTMVKIAALGANAGRPNYYLDRHTDYGIYRYGVPPEPGHFHIIGADPGTGIAPLRNKWVIMAWDISAVPVRMVYFEMGYLSHRQKGDYTGFIQRLKEIQAVYPVSKGDLWVESTGPQKGMMQVAWPEDIALTAVEFTGRKLELINQALQLMGNNMLQMPDIEQMVIELGNYTYQDKELQQDCVMAFICAAGAIWRYYGNSWQQPSLPEETVAVVLDRRARPMRRGACRR